MWDWYKEGKKVRDFKAATFMSAIRWKLIEELQNKYNNVSETYGYITKSHRIANGISKTHYNDAFAIAEGSTQIRNETIYSVKQSRRNNRSLEKFYDAKYIDVRSGEKVSGAELNSGRRTRNKKHNTENLRVYRGLKISKGRRNIRRKRHFYQPNDLVKYNNKVYSVTSSHKKGERVILRETGKSVAVEAITPYKFMKGLVWSQ